MAQLFAWLSSNAGLGILGAAIAFIVSTILQMKQRNAEADERQFQAFHKIVESLVSPDPKGGLFYIDRQAAVVFELRHFPRYYDFTERLLLRLKKKWKTDPAPYSDVLVDEIDLALEHIRKTK